MTWSFDGHGINDKDGKRVVSFSEGYRMTGRADKLGHQVAQAPEMLKAIKLALKTIRDPNAGEIEANKLEVMFVNIINKAKGK
jgi:hypothetical protein